MSTETIEASASTGAPATGEQTAQPGQQPAGVAQPQSDAAAAGGDQTQTEQDEADKGLTAEQRTIKNQQRRIERLIASRGATRSEVERLQQQIAELQRRQQAAASRTDEGTTEGQGEGHPKGRQLTEADVERMAAERARELHQQTVISRRVGDVLEAGEKLSGFADAVNALVEVVPFADRQGRPTAFMQAVLDADNPAAVLKHLGDHLEEAEDFADLTPTQLGRRLARLEDRLKQAPKKEISAAPKPLKPVSGGAAGAEPDPSKMSFAEFKAWREGQIAARRQR